MDNAEDLNKIKNRLEGLDQRFYHLITRCLSPHFDNVRNLGYEVGETEDVFDEIWNHLHSLNAYADTLETITTDLGLWTPEPTKGGPPSS